MTDPQGSVPIIEPGNPHFRLHLNIQSLAVLCFSAQAGPASPPGTRRPNNKARESIDAIRKEREGEREGRKERRVVNDEDQPASGIIISKDQFHMWFSVTVSMLLC
jgi:hypothetical protein